MDFRGVNLIIWILYSNTMRNNFPTFLSVRSLLTLLFELYKTVTMKFSFQHYISVQSFNAHDNFKILMAVRLYGNGKGPK